MERITALYIGRVGDVIVATPFLRAIRRRYPQARIRLIVGWRSTQVLPLIPFIDEWAVLEKPARIGAHLGLAWKLLSGRCDLLVDLNSSFSKTSTMIARAVRAPRRLAFDKGKAWLLKNKPADTEDRVFRLRALATLKEEKLLTVARDELLTCAGI